MQSLASENPDELSFSAGVIIAIALAMGVLADSNQADQNDAITIAGFNVLQIVNEPTAAAIAYGLDQTKGEHQIMVDDLGGGVFDVSLLSIDEGVFEVLAIAGDTHLGGEDFDNRFIDYFIQLWKRKHNREDITTHLGTMGELKRDVENLKRTLSSQQSACIQIHPKLLPEVSSGRSLANNAKRLTKQRPLRPLSLNGQAGYASSLQAEVVLNNNILWKRVVLTSIERAIRDIIGPVVERSVTIANII
ncbi:ATPase with role in protein import into the ER [Puccinia graminis f. sp. tritici]|uniref:ATPase with role in protein import into the ER n=1 Tax=Puccinia graminis f. sp. tritici TaxID=56615 RepID=A0A5B0Q711_PUCGR|nr:ATPase with role in protein import into the ER [Puccinia graminis f. sp. tritici]